MITTEQIVALLPGTMETVFAGLKMKDVITQDVLAAIRVAVAAGRVKVTYNPKTRVDDLTRIDSAETRTS